MFSTITTILVDPTATATTRNVVSEQQRVSRVFPLYLFVPTTILLPYALVGMYEVGQRVCVCNGTL